MKIVIINYGAGNIQSIMFAIERLGFKAVLSNNPAEIQAADKVIFPGVGEASSAMLKLRESGLDSLIPQLKQPLLGICLGMQLMCKNNEEGNTVGMGIFDINVKKFPAENIIPHMGWNTLDVRHDHALLAGIPTGVNGLHAYFVHSYHLAAKHRNDVIATTNYGGAMTAFVGRDNMAGAQFHPEKSQTLGLALISNFLRWKP